MPSETLMLLSDLPHDCSAVIAVVDGSVAESLELGFVPGAHITPAYNGPDGNPRVYELEGTLVALRHAAARHIRVNLAGQGEKEGG